MDGISAGPNCPHLSNNFPNTTHLCKDINSISPEQIMEIIDGVSKLSGHDKFKFRYYKNFRSMEATLENFQKNIPSDPDDYGIKIQNVAMESYQNFFNKSLVKTKKEVGLLSCRYCSSFCILFCC